VQTPASCPANGSAAGGPLEDAVTTDFSELCETKSCASRARRLDRAPAHQPRREGYVRLPRLQGFASGFVLLGVSCKVGIRAGVREFLSRDPRFASAAQISSAYDGIYTRRSQVWEDQGRTLQFISYFSELAASCSTGRLLEIGCGEGYLLAQLRAAEKVAVDISAEALSKAGPRTGADCSVALAERLPFATESFDIVVSVGVMEHFLDDLRASAEICRVLKPSGWYLALIHVKQSYGQKVGQKLREYIYPSFRPLALVRWLSSKVYRPVYQPIQHGYTPTSARACLAAGGFDVTRTISTATEAAAPLAGPHVVIYVARKRDPHASPA